ncbi:hypothetical protein [Novosphingobium sp. Leaf2]|uniref:hypothetical protein n=1 Tax=Novosphingobium sp. Leaf2 TaxID=1735670 RepID=UPI000A8F0A90
MTNETHADREAVPAFALGDRVTTIRGSKWTGHVVGFSKTGYAVESEMEEGSVQIHPEAALCLAPPAQAEASTLPGEVVAFQLDVDRWMDACFGEAIKADQLERADRFTEEALELAQTFPAFTAERAHALVDYVFGRPVGEPTQEVGGVMVTLAALCNTAGLSISDAANTELARIWTKVEAIRAKQKAKPTGSALPIATLPTTPAVESGEDAAALRDPVAIWKEACIGREGYCSPDLQDAAKQAIRIAQAEASGWSGQLTRSASIDTPGEDDHEFLAAWRLMEAKGYQWSEGNIEKAHLGWLMARTAQPVTPDLYAAAKAIHEGRSDIPWEATINQDLAYRDARAALSAAETAIRAKRDAEIVGWLREKEGAWRMIVSNHPEVGGPHLPRVLADAIERGEI